MNTNTHNPPQMAADSGMEAELRARVPSWMKEGVRSVAKPRVLDDADILREAVQEYLARRGVKAPDAHPVEQAA